MAARVLGIEVVTNYKSEGASVATGDLREYALLSETVELVGDEPAILVALPLEGKPRAFWPPDMALTQRILFDLDEATRALVLAMLEASDEESG